MKRAHLIFSILVFSSACAYGQMTVLNAPIKDPDLKAEQRTATIVHYEKMRSTARSAIRVLALALQNSDGSGARSRLNDAINNEEDIVDWANWCILALRDKTEQARACVYQPEPK
jgi:hypothetical protein